MTSSPFSATGRLRAAINTGNAVLARKDGDSARGVSVDLATEFGKRLGVPLELVVVDTAAKSVDAIANGQADIGFFAIDPKRGEQIAFTPSYVVIEGAYLVKDASPLRANEEVDRAGTRVVVGNGSAYDLFLTREMKQATIVRAPSAPAVVDHFLQHGADVAAGVRQQLEIDMHRHGGLRLLPGRFMQIRQAMGCPKAFGAEAARMLALFVEEMKASGFVAQALARHGVDGVAIAPAEAIG
ncbi:ABC transporter substrate-binding protein [Ramlibacter algicola]|uniref:ABC transporter substrate-binding protein n=1 Tax=Ramlibacter algicola TaxID=2795217 RepID=A0A934Q444_9BURK|nr:ABC transporter substrate-binding protein [Ramlibacter algicola]MBK0394828.1 ABC transporter substrate-binding protein [Ramlibacter algicola]